MKFRFTVCLLVSCSASLVKATPHFVDTMKTPKPNISQKCLNFSGNWVGHCVLDNGTGFDDRLKINMRDCFSIRWDDTIDYPIGGRRGETISESTPSQTFTSNVDFDWASPEKSELKIESSWEGRSLGSNSRNSGNFSGSIKVVDAKLEFSGTWIRKYRSTQTAICTYSKDVN